MFLCMKLLRMLTGFLDTSNLRSEPPGAGGSGDAGAAAPGVLANTTSLKLGRESTQDTTVLDVLVREGAAGERVPCACVIVAHLMTSLLPQLVLGYTGVPGHGQRARGQGPRRPAELARRAVPLPLAQPPGRLDPDGRGASRRRGQHWRGRHRRPDRRGGPGGALSGQQRRRQRGGAGRRHGALAAHGGQSALEHRARPRNVGYAL